MIAAGGMKRKRQSKSLILESDNYWAIGVIDAPRTGSSNVLRDEVAPDQTALVSIQDFMSRCTQTCQDIFPRSLCWFRCRWTADIDKGKMVIPSGFAVRAFAAGSL